jgi:hypothetical protein
MKKFGLNIEFEGYPFYIESAVTGGPISDFGSHYGIKANLIDKNFAKIAYYTCLPGMGGMFSHSWVTLNEKHPKERKTFFYPFYIKEEAVFGDLKATSKTFFISTDTLILTIDMNKEAKASFVIDSTNTGAQEYMIDESAVCDICPHPVVLRASLPRDYTILRAKRFREKAPLNTGMKLR